MKRMWAYITTSHRHPVKVNRLMPSRPVFWLRLTQGTAILAAYFLSVSWVLLERARPQVHTMFDWRWDKQVRGWWDMDLALLGERFLLVSLCMCLLGLIVYWRLRQRISTRAHWVLGIVGALSLISLLFCEINF